MELHGKVKSLRLSIYRAIEVNGEYVKQERAFTKSVFGNAEKYILFNQNGNIVEEIIKRPNDYQRITKTYNPNGNILEYCEYDILQNCIFKKVTTYNRKDSVVEEAEYRENELENLIKYKYDFKGYMVKKTVYDRNDLYEKTVFKNDKKGNPVEIIEYDSDGKITSKDFYKYDKNGNEIEYTNKLGDDTFYKTTSTYNEKNKRTEYKQFINEVLSRSELYFYDEDQESVIGEIKYKKEYNPDSETYESNIFDKKGNLVESSIKRIQDNKESIEYEFIDIKYNDSGYKIESKTYYDNELSSIKTWSYDEFGNVINDSYSRRSVTLMPGYVYESTQTKNLYQYDMNKNLIRRVYISSQEGTFILEYEIEYYN